MAVVAGSASGEEEYAKLEFKKNLRSDITWSKVFRGELPIEGNEEALEAFFRDYIFAEMTDPEKVSQYPTLRKSFHARYVRAAAQTPAALVFLNKFAVKELSKVVAGKLVEKGKEKYFHPAARYNAVLLIGELDQKVPTGGGAENKPVPYAEALDVLVKVYRAKAMPEAIRAGALSGIERHASLNVPSSRRDQLTDVMVELVAEKTPPGGRDPQVHDWLRRRAAETLAQLGQAGTNNRVAIPLAEVLTDTKSSTTLRSAAADALARLKYESAENLDSAALAKQMGELATRICEQKALQVEERGAEATQRELVQQLSQLKQGMQAPLTLAKFSKTDGAPIESLEKELGGAVKMLDGFKGDDGALKRDLNKWAKSMRAMLGPSDGESKTAPTEKTAPKKKPEIIAPEIEVDPS